MKKFIFKYRQVTYFVTNFKLILIKGFLGRINEGGDRYTAANVLKGNSFFIDRNRSKLAAKATIKEQYKRECK